MSTYDPAIARQALERLAEQCVEIASEVAKGKIAPSEPLTELVLGVSDRLMRAVQAEGKALDLG